MKTVQLEVLKSEGWVTLGIELDVADRMWLRLKGLLGSTNLPEQQGILLKPCNQIHTFGMKYPIDVLFMDRSCRVKKVVHSLAPGRMAGSWAAISAIEVASGVVDAKGVHLGDKLRWL